MGFIYEKRISFRTTKTVWTENIISKVVSDSDSSLIYSHDALIFMKWVKFNSPAKAMVSGFIEIVSGLEMKC